MELKGHLRPCVVIKPKVARFETLIGAAKIKRERKGNRGLSKKINLEDIRLTFLQTTQVIYQSYLGMDGIG